MTEKGEPMLLIGLLTPGEVTGAGEVMEAAEDGPWGGDRWPGGGEETDELSGLRESGGVGRGDRGGGDGGGRSGYHKERERKREMQGQTDTERETDTQS